MKNAKKIGGIGQLSMIVGSLLYLIQLVADMRGLVIPGLMIVITLLYAVAIVLMVIGRIGTRGERRAAKQAKAMEKNAA